MCRFIKKWAKKAGVVKNTFGLIFYQFWVTILVSLIPKRTIKKKSFLQLFAQFWLLTAPREIPNAKNWGFCKIFQMMR